LLPLPLSLGGLFFLDKATKRDHHNRMEQRVSEGSKPKHKKTVYVDLIDSLVQWEDGAESNPHGTKEVFCGVTHLGEELIRFASPINDPQKVLSELREHYNVLLISSNPKIYTNALNSTFELGFNTKNTICAEEYFSTGLEESIPLNAYPYKENDKTILVSLSPKNSNKSRKQRSYLSIQETNQLNFQEVKELLRKKRIKKETKDNITYDAIV